MKKCRYHCDYGDGENCHYEGESGCVNTEQPKKEIKMHKECCMNESEELKAMVELVTVILLKCKEFADKDKLDFKYVVKVTAEAMLEAVS